MVSKMFIGGLGTRYLRISRLRVSVVGGGSTRGKVVVYVNPDDHDPVERVFRQSALDSALEAIGDGLLVGSVFSSAFQGIALLGLLAGKGPGGAARELVERAFPDLPSQMLHVTSSLHDQAMRNHLLARRVLAGLGPGGGGGGGRVGGRPRVDGEGDTQTAEAGSESEAGSGVTGSGPGGDEGSEVDTEADFDLTDLPW